MKLLDVILLVAFMFVLVVVNAQHGKVHMISEDGSRYQVYESPLYNIDSNDRITFIGDDDSLLDSEEGRYQNIDATVL